LLRRNSSEPVAAVEFDMKMVPLKMAKLVGNELAVPGARSYTCTVPAVVPSLFQTSLSKPPPLK
jgi:hypothetical protein